MEYTKKDLGSYQLHLIKTKKFKTIYVRVMFRTPIKKDTITIRNILCDMFMQSSKEYDSKRALTIKAQDLYAADISTSNNRLGNYINTNFYLTVLNDKYTEKGNFKEAVKFLSEMIFNPDVSDWKFNPDKLDIVKNSCKNALDSIKEDSKSYSLIRMFEAFDKDAASSYRLVGYSEDLDKIDASNLYEYYQEMIKTNLVDIFVIGDIDEEEMVDLFRSTFKLKVLKKQRVPYLLPDKPCRKKRLFAKEEIDNAQSKLAIACRCNNLSEYERNYALTLYNIILGGGSDSKLFKEVREKNSLCYVIHSVPNKLDNVLIIQAGIDRDNYKKTVDLIDKNLMDMRKGKFSDTDIKIAKEYYETAMEEVEESQERIVDNYLMMDLIGTDTIEAKREKMSKVTKEEIVRVAKKIKMDTVFCLEGVKDERD